MKSFIKNKLNEVFTEVDAKAKYKDWARTIIPNQKTKVFKIFKDLLVKPAVPFQDKEYVTNIAADKEFNSTIKTLLIDYVKENECFHNSAKVVDVLADKYPNSQPKFVLGFMSENGKLFGHAWNSINGKDYDFTAEKSVGSQSTYFKVAEFNNMGQITSLPVFDPNNKCDSAMSINGESYDVNGKCSIYPYFLKYVYQ